MHDIRQARQADLRRSVSMVTQEVQLFQTTVRNNLTLFDDSIPEERILQVIDSVGLGSWFSALPKGLDSILEQDNTGLSAGEAQLLAFGRVFLTNPGLPAWSSSTKPPRASTRIPNG
jgi:ATP-binding cassette subfamily B protein